MAVLELLVVLQVVQTPMPLVVLVVLAVLAAALPRFLVAQQTELRGSGSHEQGDSIITDATRRPLLPFVMFRLGNWS